MPKRSIFRESAIKRYQQRQEQGTVLQVAKPPALIFFWLFLLILPAAGGFVGSIRVPILIQSRGVVVEETKQIGAAVVGAFFFSPNQLTGLRVGQPAIVSIGSLPTNVSGTVEQVDTIITSPYEARSRFNLQGGLAAIVTGPSVIVTISIGLMPPARMYVGSLCAARIQTGTQSVLSLLPGFNQLLKRQSKG